MATQGRRKRSRTRVRKKANQRIKKVRLAIECTPTERKYMKMLAAHEEKTLGEFVLESVRMRFQKCRHPHNPNPQTEVALEDAEQKRNLRQFSSIEDFFKSLGS